MEKLIGKTIKSIEQPVAMDIIDVDGYEVTRYDDNIKITFTDGTVLKLSSWDFEGYRSGIYKQIITN